MLFPLLPCYSLDYLGWQLLDQPFLFHIFPSFHPSLPRFPHGVYNCFDVYTLLRLSSALPDPILVPVPVFLVPVPISVTVRASVSVPVPVAILCSSTYGLIILLSHVTRGGPRRSLSLPEKDARESKAYILLVVGQTIGLLSHVTDHKAQRLINTLSV